jgi:hypothetical protein
MPISILLLLTGHVLPGRARRVSVANQISKPCKTCSGPCYVVAVEVEPTGMQKKRQAQQNLNNVNS